MHHDQPALVQVEAQLLDFRQRLEGHPDDLDLGGAVHSRNEEGALPLLCHHSTSPALGTLRS